MSVGASLVMSWLHLSTPKPILTPKAPFGDTTVSENGPCYQASLFRL